MRVNKWLQRQKRVLSRAEKGIWECLQTAKVTSGLVKDDAKNRCPLIPVPGVTDTSVNQNVWLPTYLTVCVQPGSYCCYCRTAIHLPAAPPALSECIRSASHFDCRGKNDTCSIAAWERDESRCPQMRKEISLHDVLKKKLNLAGECSGSFN